MSSGGILKCHKMHFGNCGYLPLIEKPRVSNVYKKKNKSTDIIKAKMLSIRRYLKYNLSAGRKYLPMMFLTRA